MIGYAAGQNHDVTRVCLRDRSRLFPFTYLSPSYIRTGVSAQPVSPQQHRQPVGHHEEVVLPRHGGFQHLPAGPVQADHWLGEPGGNGPGDAVPCRLPHPGSHLHRPVLRAPAQHADRSHGSDCHQGQQTEQEDLEAAGQTLLLVVTDCL